MRQHSLPDVGALCSGMVSLAALYCGLWATMPRRCWLACTMYNNSKVPTLTSLKRSRWRRAATISFLARYILVFAFFSCEIAVFFLITRIFSIILYRLSKVYCLRSRIYFFVSYSRCHVRAGSGKKSPTLISVHIQTGWQQKANGMIASGFYFF